MGYCYCYDYFYLLSCINTASTGEYARFLGSDPLFLRGEILGGKAVFSQYEHALLPLEWDEHPEPLEATCEKRQEENSGEGKKRESERRPRCED